MKSKIQLKTIENYTKFFNKLLLPKIKSKAKVTISTSNFISARDHFENTYGAIISPNLLPALAKKGLMFKRISKGVYYIKFNTANFVVDPIIARNIIQAVNDYQTGKNSSKNEVVIAKKECITPKPEKVEGKYIPVEDVKALLEMSSDSSKSTMSKLMQAYEMGRKFAKEHPLM